MSTKVMIQLIADYFKTQPVLKAWLFGSFARGEETEDSDLDILVEYDKNARISLLTISHAPYLEHTRPAEFANQFLQEVTIAHRDSKY